MAELVANGVRLHVQRLAAPALPADAPHVVFLHGLIMDNLSSWFFTVANPAAQHARVLLYDLRGHGKSERPVSGYALSDMVADLTCLLDRAELDRPVVLMGNSFGGLLALAYARARPERVAGLFLVDTQLADAGFGSEMAATLELQGDARDQRIVESFSTWLGRHSARKRTRLADTASALVHRTSLVSDLRQTPPLSAADFASVRAPICALYGEHSDVRARGEALLSRLPSARLEIVPGCSHSLLWEATDLVRERALQFIRRSAH